jgi:hypothetical protein
VDGDDRSQEKRVRRALDPLVGEAYVIGAKVEVGVVQVADPPAEGPPMADGEYALAVTPELLYLARLEPAPRGAGPQQHRLRLVESTMVMAFGGPPFHATLHLEHPATGRLIISLPAIEFAHRTELAYRVATGELSPVAHAELAVAPDPAPAVPQIPNPIPRLRARLRPRRNAARSERQKESPGERPPADPATH